MTDPFPSAALLPQPFDGARAERTLAALAERGVAVGEGGALLAAAFGNSAYLSRLALREADFLQQALNSDPDDALRAICDAACAAANAPSVTEAMAQLRQAKRRAALVIALADIGERWGVAEVTGALCRFADAAVRAALRMALRQAAEGTPQARNSAAELEQQTGLVVLAMGKYGAGELNYSSDIDLIVFYEADVFPFRKRDDPRGAAVDIVRTLVKLLSEVTSDGYVFRTDLRLRPDAGATQIAISTDAALSYYESIGQNWERAAMIKARACAGDARAGARFLKAMEPFVWRRNLDYAAIEDIHSIKRQIHAHQGHAKIAIAGHNIKLGRGGIREIEFFAQTQQLIAGGRNANLRPKATLDALAALSARGLIAPETQADLAEAYLFLRRLEHRLQMIDDEQTHTLPKSAEGLAHVACFAGFGDTKAFAEALRQRLTKVSAHYARLFERSAPLADSGGSLVFTGVEEDPETLQTLAKLGFRDTKHVSAAIRGWHHGRVRATRGGRARELLTRLMPVLLAALARTADPDVAFAQFDRFVSAIPAGVQLFSLLLANPQLLDLIANICGSAPRLAAHLGRSPAVLDALMDANFLAQLPSREALDAMLAGQTAQAEGFEAALDAARRFAREEIFRVGVQIVEGRAGAAQAGPAFAAIAETTVTALLAAVEAELAARAGSVQGGRFVVIAMGKLGGREMSAASDLDLVFVYDAPTGVESSDGAKKLPVSAYYARLAQRLIAALTVLTAEGPLYEVDMRLRPTGNKGPVAVSLESFARYHASDAWTWERMAMTRARAIAGDASLAREVERGIRASLCAAVDPVKIVHDAGEMREKLAAQFPGRNAWDLKFAPGGLVDIEFAAQTLQLCAAPKTPGVLDVQTVTALEKLRDAGALAGADAAALIAAAELEGALMQVLRISVEGTLDTVQASPGLRNLLVRAGAAPDFEGLEARLAAAQAAARAAFSRVLGAY